MIEINLIPDVKRELLRTRMLRNMIVSLSVLIGIVSIAAVVIGGLILGGQLAFEAKQDGDIKQKHAELMREADLNKTVTLQSQLDQIETMHADKKMHSRLFEVIQAVNPATPNNVQLSLVRLDPENKTVRIEGSAVNGYAALEVLKKTITNTRVRSQAKDAEQDQGVILAQDMTDGETSFGENAEGKKVLRFSFQFTYPDELFARTKEGVSIVTPAGRVDVTDSRVGVPESLFAKDEPAQKESKEKEQ